MSLWSNQSFFCSHTQSIVQALDKSESVIKNQFSYFCSKTYYIVGTQKNCLNEIFEHLNKCLNWWINNLTLKFCLLIWTYVWSVDEQADQILDLNEHVLLISQIMFRRILC